MDTFLDIGIFVLSIIGILFLIFGVICLGILTALSIKFYKWSKKANASLKSFEAKGQQLVDTASEIVTNVRNFDPKEQAFKIFSKGNTKNE